jgi:hypothetical protein
MTTTERGIDDVDAGPPHTLEHDEVVERPVQDRARRQVMEIADVEMSSWMPRPRNPNRAQPRTISSASVPRLLPTTARTSSSDTVLPKLPSTIARHAAPQSAASSCWMNGIRFRRPASRRDSRRASSGSTLSVTRASAGPG